MIPGRLAKCAWLLVLALALVVPAAHAQDEDVDPWEPMNRGIFAFNETFDQWFFEPLAIGYDFVTPKLVSYRSELVS